MNGKEKSSERERRDWVIILIILLFGFLCVILAGQWAVRFSPTWKLDTNMQSNLDPDSDFLTNRPVSFFEPLDPSILTQPAWINVFLTPGVTIEPRTPPPADTPVGTNTPVPTLFISPTPVKPTNTPTVIIPTPTNTSPYFPPPPSTRTSTPPVTPLSANLQITMSDGSTSYIVGGTITYTITVYNLIGPSNVSGATVTDNFPAVLSNITWTCATVGGATCPANGTGNINTSVNLPVGSSATFTVNADVSPAATNNPLTNTATVTLPGSVSDPNLANNTVTDNSTPVFNVNLQVTKSDGVASYAPGSPLTYTIAVANTGPANVTGATVIDIFPAIITSATWTCAPAGGATCTAGGTGNINNTVNIPDGGSVTYTVNANTDPAATTNLVNTVTVTLSAIYNNAGNNSATDTDTPAPSTDLSITKTDGGLTAVNPGGTVTYTIRVTNGGPNNVTGAILSDPAATGLTKTAVVCSAAPGQCVTPPTSGQLESGTFALPALNNGQFYEITVSATVTATSGSVTNTATVAAPTGNIDPDSGNNSASDTNTVNLVADLSITITDNSTEYIADAWKVYEIVVSNAGPSDVTGATVTNVFSNGNVNPATVIWDCTPIAVCTTPAGSGNLNEVVNLTSGSSVTFYVTAQAVSAPTGDLVNDATVTVPGTVTDPGPGLNSASDTDTLIVSSGTDYGSIGTGPGGDIEPLPAGGPPVVLTLSSPITIGSHAGWDLVYYEQDIGGVAMDWIILEVSDGSNWYTVLNWGDGAGNPGTNIDLPLPVPPNTTTCAGEPDNCMIDPSLLYPFPGYGIAIDLDNAGLAIPNGAVISYLRITVPSGGDDGGAGIDGIYVVP